MTNDLIIYVNGQPKDAYEEFGVRMNTNFVSTLLAPVPYKKNIENTSRMTHGKRIIIPRVGGQRMFESREFTLNVTIDSNDTNTYRENKDKFYRYLGDTDVITIKVGARSEEFFNLVYIDSSSYAEDYWGRFGSVAVKFCEPDPSKRSEPLNV